MPVWKTVQRTVPFWLVGIAPAEILGREIARTAARLHTLPVNHPLTERRLGTTVTGWSRLTSMANLHPPNGGGPRPLDPETPSASGMAEPGGGGPAQKTPHTDAPTGSRPRPVLADPQTAIPPGHPLAPQQPLPRPPAVIPREVDRRENRTLRLPLDTQSQGRRIHRRPR
ncbi:hypothetical protein SMACR_09810 [Sordaria macrospora]|uniref:Uncharacterized protein n=1 Tax=Sordaria macrospora TaxID=5147 RepID=A0A8S8ZEX9_SORMA|nr:hypothetical protein SMACR_09810 [Sordaria macrospora]WPJ65841.1 hypothetical protein SMAC4_09810 [Sordaria macrospora]